MLRFSALLATCYLLGVGVADDSNSEGENTCDCPAEEYLSAPEDFPRSDQVLIALFLDPCNDLTSQRPHLQPKHVPGMHIICVSRSTEKGTIEVQGWKHSVKVSFI